MPVAGVVRAEIDARSDAGRCSIASVSIAQVDTLEARLEDNTHFELLGFYRDTYFVRSQASRSVVKLRGFPNKFMLAQIAPLSWWQSQLPPRPVPRDWQAAAFSFTQASARKGLYDEVGIAQRQAADGKRAAQPAPLITKNGLPAAIIVRETRDYLYVKCPFCGGVHPHGAPLLGPRVPGCARSYPGIGEYEIVRAMPAL